MVTPLTFKGDKPKKRKRNQEPDAKLVKKAPTISQPDPEDAANDDTWVSADSPGDLSGPVLILLPTQPVTCLGTDANGKIFASAVENIVGDDPSTAEPHDVRQVWVATRVAGTQTLAFKGFHGRHLTCDKHGFLSAITEAIGPEEGWVAHEIPDHISAFALQNVRERFLAVGSAADDLDASHTELRGDAEQIGFTSTLRLRMQARFKPRLKRNKETMANTKISRRELEDAAGRRLDDEEVRTLKKARREGHYHEALTDVKVKGKHDKFA